MPAPPLKWRCPTNTNPNIHSLSLQSVVEYHIGESERVCEFILVESVAPQTTQMYILALSNNILLMCNVQEQNIKLEKVKVRMGILKVESESKNPYLPPRLSTIINREW